MDDTIPAIAPAVSRIIGCCSLVSSGIFSSWINECSNIEVINFNFIISKYNTFHSHCQQFGSETSLLLINNGQKIIITFLLNLLAVTQLGTL